jgi:hypothetical protein
LPSPKDIQAALEGVRDFETFSQGLLAKVLNWPIQGEVTRLDDISFGWDQSDLRAVDLERRLVEGEIKQIQPLQPGQPWGIFVLEFKHPEVFTTGLGLSGTLRRVLRGLVPSRRRDSALPSWNLENLLFVCTHSWQHFRFAYFRSPVNGGSPRLRTFGWSPGTSSRTVCEFNLPPLAWPEDTSDSQAWVAHWSKAFDKEPLTNDFFKRFDDVLDKIKNDLVQYQGFASAEAYSKSQLLLERLLFLYFLQNRGWLAQDRKYLLSNYNECREAPDKFTYYAEFLERLFWTLSSPPGSAARLDGIPFLNGGLFDEDEFAQTVIRKNQSPPLTIRNSTFAYVFEHLLEAFNFTVCEDTPLNQDVAVDPEMLGKVFESIVLHAEAADPDAMAPDKRKATGSYYTPRIVVHFICREVLYQYLLSHLPGEGWGPRLRQLLEVDATDGLDPDGLERLKVLLSPQEASGLLKMIKGLKTCDPAVGSGAFPVGLLHELVNLRRVVEAAAKGYVDPGRRAGSKWIQETKEDVVQNCLYGVDIQQQAIEICCLRLWLSLMVDYDLGVDPFQANREQFLKAIDEISQLPNLEMNFRRGDSLHDHISGVPVIVEPSQASAYAKDFDEIRELGAKLHKAKRSDHKRGYRLKILAKRLALSEKVIAEELNLLQSRDNALTAGLFESTETDSKKRLRIAHEMEKLREAQAKIAADKREVEKLAGKPFDRNFYPKLRRLEGADFDSPFNFAWRIDFPSIFAPRPVPSATLNGKHVFVNEFRGQMDITEKTSDKGGFDIIVGNPPFVTARNPVKREMWRARWPLVCYEKYSLVAPFFQRSFSLLRNAGQLGFIVSNAFMKREFGKPLVENYFPLLEIREVIDCSGLSFPGHGTPTCLIFGSNIKPDLQKPIRITSILPGGGDLHTPPEESPLWYAITAYHTEPGHRNSHISVADRLRDEMAKWPWNLEKGSSDSSSLISEGKTLVRNYLLFDIGFDVITAANDIFGNTPDVFRRAEINTAFLSAMVNGDDIRNYAQSVNQYILRPYDPSGKPILDRSLRKYLTLWKEFLSVRSQFHKTQIEAGLEWFEYREYHRKGNRPPSIGYPEISTHSHFMVFKHPVLFVQTAPVIKLPLPAHERDHHLLAGLLNSGAALFWLKQVCFNKIAGENEERDNFVFAGGKVQQLPVPEIISESLRGKHSELADYLQALSLACWERGRLMPGLALRRLFEKPGEAYHDWNSSLSGYTPPDKQLGPPFQALKDLNASFFKACTIRDGLRAEMVARQEEMDWLVYGAYGLIKGEDPAVQAVAEPEPLDQAERPFRLWAKAEGDFNKAEGLIPKDWSADRKRLWQARLAAIRDNEHIRRIEQPVYKRRWDEQWKVGNSWVAGEPAYQGEFLDAFDWWLAEKAEFYLEHEAKGGPVEFSEWAEALWKDDRIQAAWPVAAELSLKLERWKSASKGPKEVAPVPSGTPDCSFAAFAKHLKEVVDDETVPEGIPFAVPYEDLEKKGIKVPGKVRKIRGKLNVPRERFRSRSRTSYIQASLER